MIDSFTGEYFFLSNFSSAPILWETYVVPTSEHAYAMAKAKALKNKSQYAQALQEIAAAPTPGLAKKAGRRLYIDGPTWHQIRIPAMREILRLKFDSHGVLQQALKKTSPHMLIEGNDWGDTFWGMVDNKGSNMLGCLLMELRGYYINRS